MKGSGQVTANMLQWRKLRKSGVQNPIPQEQILSNLTDFVKPNKEASNEILLTMDMNAPLDSPLMIAFMDTLNLHDLMDEFLP